MKKLYAPWRTSYINASKDKTDNKENNKKNCPFCDAFSQDNTHDAKNYILYRGKQSVIMLNKYPYNSGHMMILPVSHHGELAELTPENRAELIELVSLSSEILKNVLRAEGINTGINTGIAGGGGLPGHLHVHVLPRWQGDTNFLPILGDTKIISTDMEEIYELLREAFKGL